MQSSINTSPEERKTPWVSVIVAAYNSSDFLQCCLTSLATQNFRDFEIIVVNSSQENLTAEVVSKFPFVRFFQSPHRLFPHAARNVGITMARGSLFAFTDADCRPDPNWLKELIEAYSEGHEIIGGCIDSNASTWISRAIYILKYAPYMRGGPKGQLGLAATGSMLVSRKVCESIGNFDGSIFCGDALFSWRAREAGFPPWFEPKAIVFDQDENFRRGFLVERFQRGREFGRVRALFEKWSPFHRIFRFAGTPIALFFALMAIARHCFYAGRFSYFIAALPFLLPAQAAWCVGEAWGYTASVKDDKAGIKCAL